MFCSNCGREISAQAASCPGCGHPSPCTFPYDRQVFRPGANCPRCGKDTSKEWMDCPACGLELTFGSSRKSLEVTAILCLLFGWLGAHRFYAGKPLTGLLQLCTGGGFFIWYAIDLIFVVTGNFRDGDDRLIDRSYDS